MALNDKKYTRTQVGLEEYISKGIEPITGEDVWVRSVGASLTGGSSAQYASGTTQATPTGTVALAKNPSNVLNPLALDASGNLLVSTGAAANSIVTGSLTALNTTVSIPAGTIYGVGVAITGTWVGTVSFEATIDGTNYFTLAVVPSSGASAAVTTTTVNGNFGTYAGTFQTIRVRMSAYTSGTAAVTLVGTTGQGVVPDLPVPTETHLGEVGGNTAIIATTQTVTAAAYAAGNAVGGKITLTNALRKNNGTAILQSIQIIDKSNSKAPLNIIIFQQNPTAATITDKTAFVYSTNIADQIRVVQVAPTDYVTIGGIATADIRNIGGVVAGTDGTTNLYAAVVTSGTPTFVSTSDFIINTGFLRD